MSTTAQQTPVADQLRAIITGRKMNPSEVAVAAGVAPSIVYRFMNGERGLTLDSLERIFLALGLRVVEVSGRGRPRRTSGSSATSSTPSSPPDTAAAV